MSRKQASTPSLQSTAFVAAAMLTAALVSVVLPRYVSAGDIAQSPLYLTTSVPPVVMFSMSNDHQLFQKVYSDFSDVTSDGKIDITYADDNDYFGYFDPNRCYTHSTGHFVPAQAATGPHNHHCSSAWSGNFLNWATMTRIDIVRKIIYGGKRSTDSLTETVLERATLPDDVHAFAKVLDTGENEKYTPFSNSPLTVCNFTDGAGSEWSHTTTEPPVLRVADGEWPQWAATETEQCTWGSRPGHPGPFYRIGAGEYIARVEVCVADKLEDNCKAYKEATGNSVYKPTGVMQQYGEDDEIPIRFGLVTGSFGKKAKGGVLRSPAKRITGNTGTVGDEVLSTGQFSGNAGIVSTLDAFRVVGRDYGGNIYSNVGNGWDCTDNFDLLKDEFLGAPNPENNQAFSGVDNSCPSWGNPISEIYLETLRYLAAGGGTPSDATAASPTPAFDVYAGSTPDSQVLPSLVEAAWDDPIEADQYCAKSHVVLISTGSNSFDKDQLTGSADIGLPDVAAKTDEIGVLEGIHGNSFFVADRFVCSPSQTVTSLAGVTGICPTVPGLEGGYEVAGLAFHANTTDFRSPSDIEQKVETFAIALARDLPEFTIPVGGGAISFVPIAGADNDKTATEPDKAESMVDVLIRDWNTNADGSPVSGRIWVLWEDSSWGEDYDLDNIQQIEFCAGTACNTFLTSCHADGPFPAIRPDPNDDLTPPHFRGQQIFDPTTDIDSNQLMLCTGFLSLAAGHANMVGYAISGSTDDGAKLPRVVQPHDAWGPNFGFWSVLTGDYPNLNPPLPPEAIAGDAVWEVFTPETGTPAAGLLESPLWYAAKYGGFKDLNDNGKPDLDIEWDVDRDGVPDNYFLVDNPGLLGPRLARFLDTALQESSAASVAANSLSQETDSFIYQARFKSGEWSGDLVKIPIDRLADPTAGDSFAEDFVWSAQERLDTLVLNGGWNTARTVITATGLTDAIPFRWSDSALGSGNIGNLLSYSVTATLDDEGEARVAYLRGDDANDGQGLGWRKRAHVLGDLINSAPAFVSGPAFNYPDDLETATYSDFKSTRSGRNGVVYIGGNDGMLHGFDDATGREVLAYVPRAVYPTLRYLTDPQYEDPTSEKHRYYVDSSPNVKDAFIDHDGDGDREWRTVLVSGLGAGGRGIFALDVTDPSTFSSAESSPGSIQLWDISAAENSTFVPELVADSGTDADGDPYSFTDLGYTFSEPTIARLPDNIHGGKWVALFGNGYPAETDLDSGTGSGKAVLYFVDLGSGALLEQVVVDGVSTDNGLSSPAAIDLNRDNRIDLIYVGDLKGNLWRIEPKSNGAGWEVSEFGTNSPKPLFTTQTTPDANGAPVNRQPITVLPEVARHPNGGQIVLFGTGKYYEKNDDGNTDLQSFYAIWDYYDAFENPPSFVTTRLSELQEQRIIAEEIISTSNTGDDLSLIAVRILSNDAVTWWSPTETTGSKGWFLDLAVNGVHEGERVVFNPAIEGGFVIFSTLIPSPNPCDFGGDSFIFIADLLTGGRLTENVFGLNLVEITLADGTTVQVPVSAIKPSSPGESTIAMQPTNIGRVRGGGDPDSCGKQLYAVSTSDGDIEFLLTDAPTCSGRKSWTEVR